MSNRCKGCGLCPLTEIGLTDQRGFSYYRLSSRFLNVGPHRSKYQTSKHGLTLASMDENAMDANMDELLDLCSGQFSSQAQHVPNTSSNKKQNMEELLNLCSGKFVSHSTS